jgi:hypothetical protein
MMNLPNPQPVLDPSEAFRRSKTMFAAQSLWHRLGGAVPLDRGGRVPPAGRPARGLAAGEGARPTSLRRTRAT